MFAYNTHFAIDVTFLHDFSSLIPISHKLVDVRSSHCSYGSIRLNDRSLARNSLLLPSALRPCYITCTHIDCMCCVHIECGNEQHMEEGNSEQTKLHLPPIKMRFVNTLTKHKPYDREVTRTSNYDLKTIYSNLDPITIGVFCPRSSSCNVDEANTDTQKTSPPS